MVETDGGRSQKSKKTKVTGVKRYFQAAQEPRRVYQTAATDADNGQKRANEAKSTAPG
jgi:hypothetical protein